MIQPWVLLGVAAVNIACMGWIHFTGGEPLVALLINAPVAAFALLSASRIRREFRDEEARRDAWMRSVTNLVKKP